MKAKYSALFTSVNLLLGVGPLILPMPFFKAGIALSTVWMIVVSVLSYNSAIFISQSIGKVRELADKKTNQQPSITFTDSLLTSNNDQDSKEVVEQGETKIDHTDQFRVLFGPKWALIPSLSISIYLMGTSVSKCIMTGKIMAQVFSAWNHEANSSTSVLEEFNFWILIFFLCGSAFSFRSVDKTKVMQMLIIGVRVVSIALFLGGAIYLVIRNGAKRVVPEGKGIFNLSNFVQIFSNSVFSLMFHHSLPNIMRTLKSFEQQKFVLRYAFIISGAVLVIIPITAVLAFGQQLVDLQNPHNLIFYNFDFKDRIDFIYWFTSFYVFLNVAAFSVYIIVIRANLLQVLAPKVDSNKLCSKCSLIQSKQSFHPFLSCPSFCLSLGNSKIKSKSFSILRVAFWEYLFSSLFPLQKCTDLGNSL